MKVDLELELNVRCFRVEILPRPTRGPLPRFRQRESGNTSHPEGKIARTLATQQMDIFCPWPSPQQDIPSIGTSAPA